MEKIEKVERLREKANVSYEEAREALEEAGGDLLDAMVLLERAGKVPGPNRSTYSTEYEAQPDYIRVRDKVEEQKNSAPSFGQTVGKLFRTAVHFIRKTVFIVKKGEDTLFTMPTAVFVLLLIFFWEALLPIMIVALFFDIRYSFDGLDSVKKANSILNKAGDFAEEVKDEFRTPDDGSDNV